LQFSLQAASPETFGHNLVATECLELSNDLKSFLNQQTNESVEKKDQILIKYNHKIIQIVVFWVVTQCSVPVEYHRFERRCCLQFLGEENLDLNLSPP
jgi:hypothetical protein